MERINFAADQVGNTDLPGIRAIIERLSSEGLTEPQAFVDRCLDMVGAYQLPDETRDYLVDHVEKGGQLQTGNEDYAHRVGQTLQLIVATQEYQFA